MISETEAISKELLNDIEEFLDNQADADVDDTGRLQGNLAMRLLCQLQKERSRY